MQRPALIALLQDEQLFRAEYQALHPDAVTMLTEGVDWVWTHEGFEFHRPRKRPVDLLLIHATADLDPDTVTDEIEWVVRDFEGKPYVNMPLLRRLALGMLLLPNPFSNSPVDSGTIGRWVEDFHLASTRGKIGWLTREGMLLSASWGAHDHVMYWLNLPVAYAEHAGWARLAPHHFACAYRLTPRANACRQTTRPHGRPRRRNLEACLGRHGRQHRLFPRRRRRRLTRRPSQPSSPPACASITPLFVWSSP